MKQRVLEWLACPICRKDLTLVEPAPSSITADSEIPSGVVACGDGHAYPIRSGVPRVLANEMLGTGWEKRAPAQETSRVIGESFGAEWENFDYEESRTWHQTVDDRCTLFLQEVACSQEDLEDKLVLDAGCGNGSLSAGISQFGCDVLAVDVSDSVTRAHAHALGRGFTRTHFVQGDLLSLPVKPTIADVLYSSGVLHHNPDTRAALISVAAALRPSGRIYIWVYHAEPGVKFWLQLRLRSLLRPWPGPAKRVFLSAWLVQSMFRQYLRRLLRSNGDGERLSWKERYVDLLDIYTPRYRWMHTQEEVRGWYEELGLADIQTTEVRDWGFGMLAQAPSDWQGVARPPVMPGA